MEVASLGSRAKDRRVQFGHTSAELTDVVIGLVGRGPSISDGSWQATRSVVQSMDLLSWPGAPECSKQTARQRVIK